MIRIMSLLILCLAAAGFAEAQPPAIQFRVPKGIYTNFVSEGTIKQAQTAAYPTTQPIDIPNYPVGPVDPTDPVLVNYFTTLLNNPVIAGLAPQIKWSTLNPSKGVYTWNLLDDVFTAVHQWNTAHPHETQKTIQLLIAPGFSSPDFVFSDIDTNVCGEGSSTCPLAGSCDGLFMSPQLAVSHDCGYTTLFYETEAGAPTQENLPMPWNAVYKSDQKTFLMALNEHILTEPGSSAFVSIAVAGPTASSTEMILPNKANQTFGGNLGLLQLGTNPPLPSGETAVTGITVDSAWNSLFANFYGGSTYKYTDQPFINEWDTAIDLYGSIFSNITLCLTTTTDALPEFPAAPATALVPASGFSSDCGTTTPGTEQQCSAVTEVISYFTNPTVGGTNAKLVFEAGMTAARDGLDLGTNGVKWLAEVTAAGTNPLPGTEYTMSRILGGVQFSHSFSSSKVNANGSTDDETDIQAEGCPTFPATLCTGLTPSQGYYNVMQLSYLPGTSAGPLFGAPRKVTYGNWVYKNAPMNFLEIYDVDVIYASGLAGCTMLQIAGSPSNGIAPDVSSCSVGLFSSTFWDVLVTEMALGLTNIGLGSTAESDFLN